MKQQPPRSRSSAAAPAATTVPAPPLLLPVLALTFVVTLMAYLPALRGTFLWDDAGHLTAPALQSWSGLGRIWFEPGATQQYYPLLHSAFWVEHQLWGDATVGYHFANILWHAIAAWLFARVLRQLAVPGALLAALVFALHPVAVESVAWIAEQKNTLSIVFYFAAALAWLRFERERTPSRYTIATLWFVAALLTKTVTATLPAALLVLAWWQRGRLSWREDVLPLLPWLALGIGAGWFTAWFEQVGIGATGSHFSLGFLERGLLAGRILWFYLGKLLWPVGLIFFYPRWTIDAGVVWQWIFPIAALALVGVAWWWRQRNRGPLAALLLYAGTLVPALGFVNVYPFVFSYVADHFQYLASPAMIAFLAAAATQGVERLSWPKGRGAALGVGVLLILGGLTWRQSHLYRDVFSLYETTLARNPSSWIAHLNLGTALDDTGRTDEALPHLQRANELKPDTPETLNSLANVLSRLGRAAEALPLVERALALQPRFAAAHNTRGVALMAVGRNAEGLSQFEQAVALDPAFAQARVNLGWAFANQGRAPEALKQFEEASRLQPDLADAELKWALTLAMNGRAPDAIPHLIRATELQPRNPEMRFVLGRLFLETGHREEAAEQFELALEIDPTHRRARAGLDFLNQP